MWEGCIHAIARKEAGVDGVLLNRGPELHARTLVSGYDQGMSEPIVVCVLGVRVEIDDSEVDAGARESIRDVWRDAMLPAEAPVDATVAAQGGLEVDTMLARLSSAVSDAALSRRSSELWLLDAVGLADSNGRVLVFVDTSGLGGQQSVQRLAAQAGYTYLAGGTVGIDAQGGVVAYTEFASVAQPEPRWLRLARVVVLSGSSRGSAPTIVEQMREEVQLKLLGARSSRLGDLRDALHVMHALLSATGGAVGVSCCSGGDLEEIVNQLLDERLPLRPIEAGRMPYVHGVEEGKGERLYRGCVADAIDFGGSSPVVVLMRRQDADEVVVLDKIASILWRAACGADVSTLTSAVRGVVESLRQDVEPVEYVRTAIATLVKDGVLSHQPGWRIDSRTAWTYGPGHVVLLAMADPGAVPTELEASAFSVWMVLAKHGSVAHRQLVQEVAAIYQVEPAEIDEDVSKLLAQLLENRAISRL